MQQQLISKIVELEAKQSKSQINSNENCSYAKNWWNNLNPTSFHKGTNEYKDELNWNKSKSNSSINDSKSSGKDLYEDSRFSVSTMKTNISIPNEYE